MAMLSPSRRFMAAQWFARQFVFLYLVLCLSSIIGICKAGTVQSTTTTPSCKSQNLRFAISLSGFSWMIWPLLVWYKWLPEQIDYPVPGIFGWLKHNLLNTLRVLRGFLWALVLGADCWWISTGGVHQHIKEVLIAQIICQVIGNQTALGWRCERVEYYWRAVLGKYGEMWPDSPEEDRSELCQKYWRLCSGSVQTALYDSVHLTRNVILREYPELVDEAFIHCYTPRPNTRTWWRHYTSEETSEALRKKMSNVFDNYVRKDSKAYKRLLEIYTNFLDRNGSKQVFEDVIVAQIVSQIYGWGYLNGFWANAFRNADVQGWASANTPTEKEYWAISQNLSHGLYNADIVDCGYITEKGEALIDPKCISRYFPGILDVQENDPNLDEDSKKLHDAMRLIEEQLNAKVIEEDPELMQICVALGQSASSVIKKAPGFKSLRTELIKEFVRIKWSTIGILLTMVYLTVGTWLYLANNREAALQWFRSALGSGMIVLLQGTAKTSSKRKRFIHMVVLILLSIGLHALIGAIDPHRHWFIRWRGLVWSTLWITWLFPMLEFRLRGKYRYGTTFVAFLTFFGRLIDGAAGVAFAIFVENQ